MKTREELEAEVAELKARVFLNEKVIARLLEVAPPQAAPMPMPMPVLPLPWLQPQPHIPPIYPVDPLYPSPWWQVFPYGGGTICTTTINDEVQPARIDCAPIGGIMTTVAVSNNSSSPSFH